MTITRRKFVVFALISVVAVVLVMLSAALAADLYLHHRAERSAGLNRWGYRGPVAGRKQAGEARFAMLGGSTAFGYGVRWDEAIPGLLETELRARHPQRRWTGLNLGYNTEGAWAFLPNLEDFSNLDYDIVILYEGYNDLLGDQAPNQVVVRRRSPVFRATGYFPILPLAFREKAFAMRAGGDVGAGYANLQHGAPPTVFQPGLATRTSANALDAAAAIAESLGRQFEGVEANDEAPSSRPGDLGCASPWVTYCESVARAVRFALAHGKSAVVATQPTLVDPRVRPRHQSQQHALAEMLARTFANQPRVAYVDLSDAVDLTDPDLAFDRMHLGTDGNRVIAKALAETVAETGADTVIDLVWTGLAALALLWPSRFIGVLDGAPLDGRVEAIVIGLLVPSLWWVNRPALRTNSTRALIAALLVWKAGTGVLATQQGLCGRALAAAPLHGVTQGMSIEEPSRVLRSWDVRADWRHPTPACTAILTRPLATLDDFPAWYLNVTDQMIGRRDVTLQARGFILMRDGGTLVIDAGPAAGVTGRVDAGDVTGAVVLDRGAHAVDISMQYGNGAWRFAPTIDGAPLWRQALVTVAPATVFDQFLAPWAWLVAPLLVAMLVGVLLAQTRATFRLEGRLLAWMSVSAAAALALAWWPDLPLHRAAGLVGLGALAVPTASRARNLRGAFLLVGVPWLVFVAAWSLPQVGRFSVYSNDDWLNYQIAGYRIFMHGYWLAGGNPLLDFQPLYQWMTGALHVIFGDSSVGEFYWDSACLLAGALLAFQVVRTSAGFRWGLAAAVAALATLTLGTPWYFLGRGLSEIAASGWAFLAMFFLLRGRHGSLAWVAAAGVLAVLMFYTRLNHLILAVFLPVFLLSLRVPATPGATGKALRGLSWMRAGMFLGIFAAGVVLFMTRTWYYTGVFSLFYGTSLRHNDTGLRPWTLFDGEVWAKVWHSLAATVFMNEPPRPDPRAVVMIVGALVAIVAFLFRPVGKRVPAVVVLAAMGGTVGAFLAHAHGYPGRFSIHLIPLACALTMCVVARRG